MVQINLNCTIIVLLCKINFPFMLENKPLANGIVFACLTQFFWYI